MPNTESDSGIARGGFTLFLALITLALVLIIWPFASPLLWAALSAIMFQPLYQWLLPRCGNSANKAALAALAIFVFAVLIPALLIGSMVIEQAADVFIAFRDGKFDVGSWFTEVVGALPASVQTTLDTSGFGTLSALIDTAQDFARESTGVIARQAVAIGGSALGFVLSFGVGLYVTFFLLRDGKQIGAAVVRTLPMDREISQALAEKFLAIVRATIKGSGVVGLVQGALGSITFWIAGVPSIFLLGMLMAIFSLLPALGPAIVWLPIAIYLLATGAIWQGILVIASGILVIGMADNVLRPILVGRDTGIPDWIILVTTLGGIGLFGLSGIVLGPLVAGLFLTAWSISSGTQDTAESA